MSDLAKSPHDSGEREARDALAELVALKDLKDRVDEIIDEADATNGPQIRERNSLVNEYMRRKPLAWEAARAALATPSQAPEPASAKALEFAEYMARGAEEFMDATDNAAMKRAAADGAPRDDHRPLLCDRADQADSDAVDALRALRRGIYEFRKRAAKVGPSQAVASALQAPEGWKLVPIEPTEKMEDAGAEAGDGHDWSGPREVWAAMLAAAPAHPVVQPGIQGGGHQAGASLQEHATLSESDPLPQICLPNGVMFDAFGEPRTRYVRVTLDGSHCVMRPEEGDTYIEDAKKNWDDESNYVLSDVFLSEREFNDLPEFDGF